MNASLISLLVFCCVFGMGYLATVVRGFLPEQHLTADTKDTIKLTMGLVATMTALILGLLVASAKGSYDTQKSDVIAMSAKFVVLDRMFAHYGPEADPARKLLRQSVENMKRRLWPDTKTQPMPFDPTALSSESLYDIIQALSPKDDSQRLLKSDALNAAIDIARARWLFVEQAGSSISVPLLVIVVCWLTVLSASFGLFAPPNGTAKVAMLVSALSVSAAIFLILELDLPFHGLIQISQAPVDKALSFLGK